MDAPVSNNIDVFPRTVGRHSTRKKAQATFADQDLNEETLLEYVPFHNSLPLTDVFSVDRLRPTDRPIRM